MRAQPLIAVGDVEASSRWYQQLLGCSSGHGGTDYERIVDTDGGLVLQIHRWDAHDHPYLGSEAIRPYGNGVVIWFQIDDFDAAVQRSHALGADVLQGPEVNPNANHRELWLRDEDGYVVVLASAYGDV